MNQPSRWAALCLASLTVSGCGAETDLATPDSDRPEASDLVSMGASDMLAYLEIQIDIADDKFMQLAEAIPEASYDWRPMTGVRSFREVFLHVAADNWYGGALMGIPTPDDIPVTDQNTSVRAYQDQVLTKAQTLEHLRRSFDYFGEALDATLGTLDRVSMLGQNEVTYGDLWVRLVTHMHEHLGQTIAYSRANEIVPPWSR